jgi:hypothetical protein
LSVNAQHSSEKGKNDAASQEVMRGGTSGELMLAAAAGGLKEKEARGIDSV